EKFWPDLEELLQRIPAPDSDTKPRDQNDMTEEILVTVRDLARKTGLIMSNLESRRPVLDIGLAVSDNMRTMRDFAKPGLGSTDPTYMAQAGRRRSEAQGPMAVRLEESGGSTEAKEETP